MMVGWRVILAQTPPNAASWPMAGHDLRNSRSQPAEQQIGPSNVNQLVTKWVFTTGNDVSATPTVADNTVYFPDWAGNLYALNAETGTMVWSHQISEYTGQASSVSRVSPAVDRDQLIIGDNVSASVEHNGANIIAVDRASGSLRWITQVDAHPAAIITGSPVVSNGKVYVGVSSNEEGLATDPAYPCCTFRGSMVSLDANTGALLWKVYTVPDNGGAPGGYSGNAIWSPAAIDASRGSLYVATGNNYTVPADVAQCQANAKGRSDPKCTAADDYFNTVLSFDTATGRIKWANRVDQYDAWTVACLSNPPGPNCPNPAGPDYDFGSGPNLIGSIVGVGQKSGIYWAFNANSGAAVWKTAVGPGGTLGGIEWGTATDGRRIYVAIANNSHKSYTLANGGPTIDWGSWAALDARTGRILWQVADPTPGAIDPGAVSVANGVMYAGSYSGAMYALNAASGAVLWSFGSGGSVIGGPSIVDGTLFWGSGYRRISPGIGNNQLYAFSLPLAQP
jgi:polyvinyl alcohol dehydrogenase (cytochrome)